MTDATRCTCRLPEKSGNCPVHGEYVRAMLRRVFGDAVVDGDAFVNYDPAPCQECEGSGWVFLDEFDRDGNQRTERCTQCDAAFTPGWSL